VESFRLETESVEINSACIWGGVVFTPQPVSRFDGIFPACGEEEFAQAKSAANGQQKRDGVKSVPLMII